MAFGDSMFGQIPEILNENEIELSDEQPLFDASKFLGFAMDANQVYEFRLLFLIVIFKIQIFLCFLFKKIN